MLNNDTINKIFAEIREELNNAIEQDAQCLREIEMCGMTYDDDDDDSYYERCKGEIDALCAFRTFVERLETKYIEK